MEHLHTSEQSDTTDLNNSTLANNIHHLANHQDHKLGNSEFPSAQPESEPIRYHSSPLNSQSGENEIAARIAKEIVNQCFFVSPEMQAKEENTSDNPSSSTVPAVVEQRVKVEKDEQEEDDENALRDESQPQPQRMMTLPAAIHIMNEFGQKTDSIDIDPNNNYHLAKLGTGENRKDSQSQRWRLTKEEKAAAVLVKNVSFGYTKNHNIISNISLHVPVGKIFALLGSSGCGKTTLLRLILGRMPQRKGLIQVFGSKPGNAHSKIPVYGYMPQELALFPNFTIKETLQYYGMLLHMEKHEVRRKTDFMIELLNLPPKDRQIGMCSGGQQRRASIAVTLFHDPPLLILDEPTVGVDPLLRCKIWQYLEYLCQTQNMTIIITTHYIEESRGANSLAFMRFGRILAQDSPDTLLATYNCTILEDVFLRLCQQDCGDIKEKYSIKKKRRNGESISATAAASDDICEEEMETSDNNGWPSNDSSHTKSGPLLDMMRMRALMFKNVLNLKRNPYVVLFFLVLPVIQITLFCYSVFKNPDNLQISVYNGEEGKGNSGLSKQFLNSLDTSLLDVQYYSSQEEAIQTVVDGTAWYAVAIGSNFTRAYQRRARNPSELSLSSFEASKIKLYVDHSDSYMLLTIYNSLIHSYQQFVESVAESFGFRKETVRLPIYLAEVVHGPYDPAKHSGYDFLNNLTPGSLVAIIYTAPLILSSFLVVLERKGGIIERTFVSGAKSIEVFLTHLIVLVIGLVVQVSLVLAVAHLIFELQIQGPLIEVFVMLYLCGLCGVLIGMLISSISPNETVALVLSLGMVFPIWMMCGVFWPLESIGEPLQRIFWLMPLSYPIRSIDQIVKRGWSYEQASVQLGYFTSLFYNSVLLVANVVAFQLTSK